MRISEWSSDVCSSDLLLKGKRAFIVFASGGVPLGSEVDFASGYLKHILGFVGITDVTVIAADGHLMDGDAVNRATSAIDGLKLAARSEEHTSELQSLMRISYAVFCLKKKKYIR